MAGCQSDVDKTIHWAKSSQQKYDSYSGTWKWQYSKKRMPNIYCGHLRIKLKIKSHLQELDC